MFMPRGRARADRRTHIRTAVAPAALLAALTSLAVLTATDARVPNDAVVPSAAPAFGATGTILQTPTFSIADASAPEGNSGTRTFAFTVSLAGAMPDAEYRVRYATADGTAVGAVESRAAATPVSIPDIGLASPYPVSLAVAGLSGTIDDVSITLNDLTHTYPEDLDMLLVGPGGQAVMFMSDVGGWNDVSNIDLTFQDGAPPPSDSQLVSGTFAPTNVSALESLPAPAPPGPYPSALSTFRGTDPNGTWMLYIEDDFITDVGTMAGFTLTFSLSGTGDYIPTASELVFPPGTTSLPVNVRVKGDTTIEPTETFAVNLSSPVNAVIGDAQAVGTIFNDDGPGVAVAVDDSFAVPFGTPLVVPAPGVLANDTINGGGVMTAVLVSGVSHGTLALSADGSFTYTATAGYAGPDAFTYRVSTTAGSSNSATVRLAVSVPAAFDDAYTTPANQPIGIAAPGVLGNDDSNGGGAMTAELVSNPAHGAVTLNTDGSFVYVPALDFLGDDTFTYRAVTTRGAGNVATVTVTMTTPTTVQAPTGFHVESVVGTTVTVRFTPPVLGPPPTGYVLKGGVLPGQILAEIPTGNTAPLFTFQAPTGSFIRMHTLSGASQSVASNEVALHVNVPVPPSPPTGLVGLVNGSSLTLQWNNTFEGGAPSSMILGVTGALTLSVPLARGEAFSFANVPPGNYILRVRGVNGGGWGQPSNPVNLTFPGPCSGAPLPPSNFIAYRIGNTIYAVWDPPTDGPAPTSFTLNVTGAYVGSFDTAGRALSGVAGPGDYKIEVIARNPCGSSGPTPPQTVTIP
ncbi:MAG: Ig-like domain-containing protein [Vicinamibacterales bacterium]